MGMWEWEGGEKEEEEEDKKETLDSSSSLHYYCLRSFSWVLIQLRLIID